MEHHQKRRIVRRGRPWPLLVAALVVVGGGAAVPQQSPNGYGGVGRRPANMPMNPQANRPQPPPPPGAVEAMNRRIAAEARGEHIPAPVWDPKTGDMMRHADGSFVMDTELAPVPLPPAPPCESAPGGCHVYRADGSVVDQSQPPPCVATGRCKP
jgi:hypothetical protein